MQNGWRTVQACSKAVQCSRKAQGYLCSRSSLSNLPAAISHTPRGFNTSTFNISEGETNCIWNLHQGSAYYKHCTGLQEEHGQRGKTGRWKHKCSHIHCNIKLCAQRKWPASPGLRNSVRSRRSVWHTAEVNPCISWMKKHWKFNRDHTYVTWMKQHKKFYTRHAFVRWMKPVKTVKVASWGYSRPSHLGHTQNILTVSWNQVPLQTAIKAEESCTRRQESRTNSRRKPSASDRRRRKINRGVPRTTAQFRTCTHKGGFLDIRWLDVTRVKQPPHF